MRAAPVAALCRWPGRAGGREGRGSLRYDHGGHPDAVAGARAPHPPPAEQGQEQGSAFHRLSGSGFVASRSQ